MKNIIKLLKENGYKVYVRKNVKRYLYAVTPNENILYIHFDINEGYKISLEYRPTAKTGSACGVDDNQPYNEITIKNLQVAEWENLKYAKELKAKLYQTPDEWLENYWDKNNLIEM